MKHIKIDGVYAPGELDGLIAQLQKLRDGMSAADLAAKTVKVKQRRTRRTAARQSTASKA